MIQKALIMFLPLGVTVLPNIVGCASGPEFPAGITGTVFEDANSHGIQVKRINMGGRIVHHARQIVFQLAEVEVPRDLFAAILERIGRLRLAPGQHTEDTQAARRR